MALVTLAQVKAQLDITGVNANQDTKLDLFREAAEAWLLGYLDRQIESGSVTDYQHGDRANEILLRQFPVTAVAELRIDSAHLFTATDTLVAATDYGIADDGNGIVLYNRVFPAGYNNIKIVYTAGYTPVPADIKIAVLWLAEWFYLHNNRKDMGRTGMGKQDENVTVLADMPGMIYTIVESYKRSEAPISNRQVRKQ